MMLRVLMIVLTMLATALHAQDEKVVLGLSQNSVAITTNFDGSDVLIFGAIKRETAIPEEPLHIIVTVAGPAPALTVRRKEKRFGIWINAVSANLDSAPSFYAVASSAPLSQILTNTEDLRHKITVPRAIRAIGATETARDIENFIEALIRIRQKEGLYQTLESTVDVGEQTLFRTSVTLPANLTEGGYTTRVFVIRDAAVISQFSTVIDVHKVGLEEYLFSLAHNQPLIYGLLSLAIAIIAGWGASTAFRLIRER